jgi:hypothetical protein
MLKPVKNSHIQLGISLQNKSLKIAGTFPYRFYLGLNATIEWLTFFLRIVNVPGLNLDQETGYPGSVLLSFSQTLHKGSVN